MAWAPHESVQLHGMDTPPWIHDAVEASGRRLHWRLLMAAGLTWTGDAMELSVMAFVIPALKEEWSIPQAALDLFSSALFVGMLVGALAWGSFSDAFGRRAGWLVTTTLTAVAGLLSAVAPNWQTFILARLLVGVGLAGTNIGFALSSELLARDARGTQLMLFELFFVGGSVLEVMLAWLVLPRSGWRSVLALSTLPLWLALTLCGGVPESPRWLARRGNERAAALVLQRTARATGQPMHPAVEQVLARGDGMMSVGGQTLHEGGDADPDLRLIVSAPLRCCGTLRGALRGLGAAGSRVVTTLFHPQLRRTSVALCASWALAWFVYFGAILLTPRLVATVAPASVASEEGPRSSSNVYATSLIAAVAEVPGLLLATRYVNRIGRTTTCAVCMLLAALALLGIAVASVYELPAEDADRGEVMSTTAAEGSAPSAVPATLQIVLLAVCRMAAFGGFSALYILTAESYPTDLRVTAFGVVSAASRFAGILTPLVAGTVWNASHLSALFVYAGAAAACAAVLRLAVRETFNQPMQEVQLAWPTRSHHADGGAPPPTPAPRHGVHAAAAMSTASTRSGVAGEVT